MLSVLALRKKGLLWRRGGISVRVQGTSFIQSLSSASNLNFPYLFRTKEQIGIFPPVFLSYVKGTLL